jgi:hypothetical protein
MASFNINISTSLTNRKSRTLLNTPRIWQFVLASFSTHEPTWYGCKHWLCKILQIINWESTVYRASCLVLTFWIASTAPVSNLRSLCEGLISLAWLGSLDYVDFAVFLKMYKCSVHIVQNYFFTHHYTSSNGFVLFWIFV